MQQLSDALRDGYKAGKTDRRIGYRSAYVWASKPHEGAYVWEYAVGYKRGWLGKAINSDWRSAHDDSDISSHRRS